MSKYSTELRILLMTDFPIDEVLGSYPIWDESYRKELNKKIVDHYYFSEIGFEMPDRWAHYLKSRMNEIMPLYNELYKSTLIDFNPLYNIDYTEKSIIESKEKSLQESESKGNTTGTGTSTGKSNTKGSTTSNDSSDTTTTYGELNAQNVTNDTPQGKITEASLFAGDHATNVTFQKQLEHVDKVGTTGNASTDSSGETTSIDSNHTSSNSTGSAKTTGDNTGNTVIDKIVQGYNGKDPLYAIEKLRQNIVNIDMMIIHELRDLFMYIY